MKLLLWFCIAAASTLTGCALFIPWEAAQGRAMTHEVQQKLGRPLTRVDEGSGKMWLYEVREEQPDHRGTPTGFWCDEYRLAFDGNGVLRDWTHRSFFQWRRVTARALPGWV